MKSHTGNLPGSGRTITASAQCIVYDHQRESVYVSTDDRGLARDVVVAQGIRDPDGRYKAYELSGEDWREIPRRATRPPRRVSPPLFHLLNAGSAFLSLF
jgi:hypothetical protein